MNCESFYFIISARVINSISIAILFYEFVFGLIFFLELAWIHSIIVYIDCGSLFFSIILQHNATPESLVKFSLNFSSATTNYAASSLFYVKIYVGGFSYFVSSF